MPKATSSILFLLLAVPLSCPVSAQSDASTLRHEAEKSAHRSSRDVAKREKRDRKRQAKALKAYKKQHHVAH